MPINDENVDDIEYFSDGVDDGKDDDDGGMMLLMIVSMIVIMRKHANHNWDYAHCLFLVVKGTHSDASLFLRQQ